MTPAQTTLAPAGSGPTAGRPLPSIPVATDPGTATAFRRSMAGEAVKVLRRPFVLVTLALVLAVAIGGTVVFVLGASDAVDRAGGLLSVQELSTAGGGTAVFSRTIAFTYVFLLAVLIAAVAQEFTRGTFRTMLLHQPARTPLLVGKMTVLVGYAFAAAAVGMVVSWITARLLAPSQGIDTSQWLSMDGLGEAATALGRVGVFLAGTAVFATAVGVVARSVPIGVGAALVWTGPVENILGDNWTAAEQWFPGLLLRAVVSPGSTSTSTGRAVVTLAAYVAVALVVIAVALRRRDVTS